MKRLFGLCALILLLTAAGYTAGAQEEATAPPQRKAPRWLSAKGYWMVEGNINQPRHSCVYFFTNENVLVHKETIDGKKLKVKRERTKMKLKKALEIAVDGWAAGQSPAVSNQLIAALLTK